jgi:hypothetical protein
MPALADRHQAADQVAHHVMQEGGGFEVEHHEIAETADVGSAHDLHRRHRLTFGGAKGGKILFTEQQPAADCIGARSSG